MPSAIQTDRRFMRAALALARRVVGLTTPNPAVGCVIVRGNRIIARGATAPGGRPHAEAIALARAGKRARGATAYVSFEPCAPSGRTPPCAKSLAEAGIARVVIACVDPYPPVRGRGIAILRRAGVSVTVGVMEKDARALNAGFITRVTRGRPLVVLKLAMSLDGKIAASSGDSKWISSAKSRDLVHRWRSECDAVMVGAGTVIADNPRLTSRVAGGRDPIRVVVDGRLRTPADARVYRIESKAGAILVTTRANLSRARRKYARSGVEVLGMPAHRGEIDLMALMREFGRRGWRQVMLEGGAHLAGSALAAGIVDRIALFVAPRIIGDGIPAISGLDFRRVRDSIQAADLTARQVDSDWLFEGRIAKRR